MTGPASPSDGHRPGDVVLLTGAEEQRVAVARALISQDEGQDSEAVADKARGQAQTDSAHKSVAPRRTECGQRATASRWASPYE